MVTSFLSQEKNGPLPMSFYLSLQITVVTQSKTIPKNEVGTSCLLPFAFFSPPSLFSQKTSTLSCSPCDLQVSDLQCKNLAVLGWSPSKNATISVVSQDKMCP